MPRYDKDTLQRFQRKRSRVRNICILAHVDHGKTTLADGLCASNAIISERLAGTLRYMDSLPEEQERLITMKSSCITLLHRYLPDPAGPPKAFIVNLIDSPGHIDFAQEVSTAVRVCDGALVVVDLLEGVGSQTHAVLKQAWKERLRPTLVLNKVDRLVTDLRMTPLEAYQRMRDILEQVNVIMGTLFATELYARIDVLEADAAAAAAAAAGISGDDDGGVAFEWDELAEDQHLYFNPTAGNVVFASARDGWAFRTDQFAEMVAAKMNANPDALRKTLWGDYFFHSKQKMISRANNKSGSLKPMFVNVILNNVWAMYEALHVDGDIDAAKRMVGALGLTVSPRDYKHKDVQLVTKAIFSAWLPLADAVLDMVVEHLPSPVAAAPNRLPSLLPALCAAALDTSTLDGEQVALRAATMACVSADDDEEGAEAEATALAEAMMTATDGGTDGEIPTVAFVAKIFSVEADALPTQVKVMTTEERERIREARLEAQRRAAADSANATAGTSTATDTPATAEAAGDGPSAASESEADGDGPSDNDPPASPSSSSAGKGKQSSGGGEWEGYERVELRKVKDIDLSRQPRERGDGDDGPVIPYFKKGTAKRAAADAAAALAVEENGEVMIAFTRVFSGTLKVGQTIQVLGPKYDPAVPDAHATETTIEALYLLMGRSLEAVDEVPAGNVCGIGGLDEHVFGTATLSTSRKCQSFSALAQQTYPLVRVAIEPRNPSQFSLLKAGLRKLHQSDPCVRISIQETGEHVILAAGELHLSRCLRDLRERFCKGVRFVTSPPIVSFRETIVDRDPEILAAMVAAAGGDDGQVPDALVEALTANKACAIRVRAEPIPHDLAVFLEENRGALRARFGRRRGGGGGRNPVDPGPSTSSLGAGIEDDGGEGGSGADNDAVANDGGEGGPGPSNASGGGGAGGGGDDDDDVAGTNDGGADFLERLQAKFDEVGWGDRWGAVWSFGPRRGGANVLFNRIPGYVRGSRESSSVGAGSSEGDGAPGWRVGDVDSAIVAGFQLATRNGPLCAEPLHGVAFSVEAVEPRQADSVEGRDYGPFSGQVMSAMGSACRDAFAAQPMRMVEAVYRCDLQSTMEGLSGLYTCMGRRRAKILDESMREGTPFFNVEALLPVVESFGMVDELRSRSGGMASAQIDFHGWQALDIDPFWEPTTEDEIEEHGDNTGSVVNPARDLMNKVRRRKGLPVNEKLVEHGEKQRTLTRMK